MIKLKKILQLSLIFSIIWGVNSQKLIDETTNYIQNKSSLQTFYDKLESGQSVNILHIGDSHIQANFFTGHLRELFQKKYGNAGRGVVFPLRLARTHGHLDIKFYSDILWDFSKITNNKNESVGLAGATISTTKPQFFIQLKNEEKLDISHIKIIGKGLEKLKFGIPNKEIPQPKKMYLSKTYRVKSGDYLGKIARKFKTSVKKLKLWNNLRSDRLRIKQKLKIKNERTYKPIKLNLNDFELVEPTLKSDEEITLDLNLNFENLFFISDEKSAKSFTKIDGIFLENQNNGVVYHSVGINSAKYNDYNKSDLFFEQLTNINPDLVIISLGTNESFYNTENPTSFKEDVNEFLDKLKSNITCKNILITTPPSSLKKQKYVNKKLKSFTEVLKNIANENNFALWNLYEITGKEKGIKNWYSKGLAFKDRKHYTQKGYDLQADMLFDALFKSDENSN